jgi:curved DNA-binding protein CbpA
MAASRVPADDLYARLQVPAGASFEAIEVAWRTLLKRHHPDVAGEPGLEATKRINVAHDWLSDPDLRTRYDRERHPGRAPSADRMPWRRRAPTRDATRPRSGAESAPHRSGARAPWPTDPAATFARFLDRLERLTTDEIDRLALAEPHAIAFAASLDRILPADRRAAFVDAEGRARQRVERGNWARLPVRDAIVAVALELTVGPYLDAEVPDPTRSRIRERLLRGWEAAIDQPRYGPNSPIVERVRERAARLSPDEVRELATAAEAPIVAANRRRSGGDDGTDEEPPGLAGPWPFGHDPSEDEALRVSAMLAARDVACAPDLAGIPAADVARVRDVLGLVGHVIALRHGFGAGAYAELVGPWRAATGDPATGRAPADQPRPIVRRRA